MERLTPTQDNITKIQNQKLPETITDVRAFCNLAGFYRKYIKNFAKVAKPLTDMMAIPGKKKRVTLSKEAKDAFFELKELLNSRPVLHLPDFDKPFALRTDASKYAIGGVLFQINDKGEERPIAFGSRVLSKTEQRYSASEREMLGIYYWIRYWRQYVWGTHFNVYTDHLPLKGIKTKKDATRRLTKNDFEFTRL